MQFEETTIGPCRLIRADCLDVLPTLRGVDAVVTDPPYGITDAEWDNVVPATEWMVAPAVVFCAEPYTFILRSTAPLKFRHDLVWKKNTATSVLNAYSRPLRQHEQIMVFGDIFYSPVMRKRTPHELKRLNRMQREEYPEAHPGTVLEFDALNNRNGQRTGHESQKPEELMCWIVESYSRQPDTILDPFMGSGTTGVACVNLERQFIGIEIDPTYYAIAVKRIRRAWQDKCSELPFEKPQVVERQRELVLETV